MGTTVAMLDDILNDLERRTTPALYPSGYYSPDGDCVFVYNEGGEYIRQRVDGLLTVFRSPDGGRIIGLQVKGIRNLPKHEALEVEVRPVGRDTRGRRIDTVRLLLLSYKQEAVDDDRESERSLAYADAIRSLGSQKLEVELAS